MQSSSHSGFQRELAETLGRLGERFEDEIRRATRGQSERLNQIVRRLRQAKGEASWSEAAVDGASAFASRCLIAAIDDANVRVLAWRGFPGEGAPPRFALAKAPAFQSAVETAEPVTALRAPGEISDELQQFFGSGTAGKAHLFPVIASGRVAAILYADSEGCDPDGSSLEIVAAAAGAAWKAPGELIGIAPARKRTWDALPHAEQAIHLKAQRMARTRVANLVLYHRRAIEAGRAARDLYGQLAESIDAAREEFRRNFLETCGSMVDYLHLELLSRIANHDAELLGPGYPGPMVQGAAIPDRVG